jgi:hypothetical protein
MTTKSDAKQRKEAKRQRNWEKRLAESKGLYFREVVDGGCVVLQSKYWRVRAELTRPDDYQDPPQEPSSPVVPSDPKDRWLAELTHIARQCRFKEGWVAHEFKVKFGFFPPWGMDIEPIPPSDEVKAWVKERRREYLATKKAQDSDERTA